MKADEAWKERLSSFQTSSNWYGFIGKLTRHNPLKVLHMGVETDSLRMLVFMANGSNKTVVPLDSSMYLLHPMNATLVTTKTPDGQNNVAAIAWITPTSVKPPLLTMSLRKERFTYKAIKKTGEFVVNIPTFDMAEKVLKAGRISGKDVDKFAELPLTPRKAKMVKAPLIEECVAHLECTLWKKFKAGDHDLIIGEIVAASVMKGYFTHTWDITKYRPVQHTGKEFFTTCSLESVEIKF